MVNSNTNEFWLDFNSLLTKKCIVSVDVGAKYTGIAIYQIGDNIIQPITTIILSKFLGKIWFSHLQKELKNVWDSIVLFVIGTHNNKEHNNYVQKYIDQVVRMLSVWTKIPVLTHCEKNSSQWAQNFLSSQNFGVHFIQKHQNSVAACRILWGFLFLHYQIDAMIIYPR